MDKWFKKIINFRKNGFSLIDTLLGIFVVVVGLLAVLGLMSKNLKNAMSIRDQAIATSLSQEGIELVRNVRDSQGGKFDKFPDADGTVCQIDINIEANTLVDCISGSYALNISEDYYYSHSAGQESKFMRKIIFNYLDGNNPVGDRDAASRTVVKSMVIWGRADFPAAAECNTGNKCVLVESVLTN